MQMHINVTSYIFTTTARGLAGNYFFYYYVTNAFVTLTATITDNDNDSL